jgi:hypothetical protein
VFLLGQTGLQLVGRRETAAGDPEAAAEEQGEQAAAARAPREGEPGAGAAGALACRRARGPEEVGLPARAEPAAQRVVADAVPGLATTATVVISSCDRVVEIQEQFLLIFTLISM